MVKAGWGGKKFLISGFPRNQENEKGWQKTMGEKINFAYLIYFEGDEEACFERIMERAKTQGRAEDNIENVKKRFWHFESEELPIIEKYGDKVKKINAM